MDTNYSPFNKQLLENTGDIITRIISHGNYLPNTFTVPSNIILQQYSPPGYAITVLEATHISNQHYKSPKLERVKPFYLIKRRNIKNPQHDTDAGNIYYSNITNFIIPPEQDTMDLELNFSTKNLENTKLGIVTNINDTTIIPDHSEKEKLSVLLNRLSKLIIDYEKSKGLEHKIHKVIQLSCRTGIYNPILRPHDYEILRASERCDNKKPYFDMQYVNSLFFNPKTHFLTYDEAFANKLSCLIQQNFPLYSYNTSEEIYEHIELAKKSYYDIINKHINLYNEDDEGDVQFGGNNNNKIKLYNNKTRKNKRNKKSIKIF